jgi:hypothetical protein
MKTIVAALVFVCLAASVFAQGPTCTQITDQIPALGVAIPGWMTGTIDLSLGYSLADGTYLFPAHSARITVTNGAVSSCLPPGYYTVSYSVRKPAPLTGSVTSTRFWTVPSTGPRTVQYIESATPTTPTLSIAWAQLPPPPPSGTWCVQSINGTIAWSSSCSASSYSTWTSLGTLTWNGLNGTWTALF